MGTPWIGGVYAETANEVLSGKELSFLMKSAGAFMTAVMPRICIFRTRGVGGGAASERVAESRDPLIH